MKRLTLIHQNDLHGHVEPHWELGWHAGRPEAWRSGGAARIAAMANAIRAEVRGACIHVDSGDAIHGTGAAQWTRGAAIVPVLNAMRVEVMTPGNWEFAYGPALLRERVAEMAFPVIAANVRRADTGEREFPASYIREAGNVRAAFIGVTSPIVATTMPQPFGAGLRFDDAVEVLPEVIASIREQERPDVVVLLSHYGFAQEVSIARAIEGIDVILGGHTHDVLAEPVMVGRTIVTQSGAHGSYLTRLDLELSHGRVCAVKHQLLRVDDGEIDRHVDEVVRDALRPHAPALEEVIGETSTLLHRGTVLEAPADTMIVRAYLAATGADVALSHGWRYGTPIPPGPITLGDLWQLIPPNPELFTVALSGAELRRMLERSLERTFAGNALRQQGGYVMRFDGMSAIARLNNPAGDRVMQLEVAGNPVDPARSYVVAAAGDQSVPPREARRMTGLRAVDVVREQLQRDGARLCQPAPPSLVAV